MKEEIVGVTLQDVEVGIKRSANLTFTIMEKVLMAMGESDIGIITAPLPLIIHMILVDNRIL